MDRALGFYRDVLGLPFLFNAGPGLAFLAMGDVRLMLTLPSGGGKAGANSVLYFKVPSIDTAHALFTGRGAQAEEAPHLISTLPDHELWLATLRDPDGNLVGLLEERKR